MELNRRSFVKGLAALPTLPWLLSQMACSSEQLTQFKNVSRTVLASANGINSTLRDLIASGKITGALASFVQTKFPQGLALISQLNDKIQVLTQWPPANKQDLLDFITSVIKFIEDAEAEGLLKFGSTPVLNNINAALAIIVGVLTTLNGLLGGVTPTPAALQKMQAAPGELDDINEQLQAL